MAGENMVPERDDSGRMTLMSRKLTGLLVSAAVGAGAVGTALELAGITSPIRVVLVLVFIAVAPTAAIAGLLRGFDRFARLVLACVTATAVVTLIAMVMLAAGLWSPTGGLIAIAAFSAACWLAKCTPSLRAAVAARAEPLRQALTRYRADGGAEILSRGAQPPAVKLGQDISGPVTAPANGHGGDAADPVMRPTVRGYQSGTRDCSANGMALPPASLGHAEVAANADTTEFPAVRGSV